MAQAMQKLQREMEIRWLTFALTHWHRTPRHRIIWILLLLLWLWLTSNAAQQCDEHTHIYIFIYAICITLCNDKLSYITHKPQHYKAPLWESFMCVLSSALLSAQTSQQVTDVALMIARRAYFFISVQPPLFVNF